MDRGIDRRTVLKGAAAGAVGLWLPSFRITPADAAGCEPPPQFPAGIPLYRQGYENWSTAIKIDELWTCAPGSPADAVRVVNWAHRHGYRIRARGMMHNWSPLMVDPDEGCSSRVVLLDTTAGLRGLRLTSQAPATVRVGAGELLEDFLAFCEGHGYGITPTPAPGSITIGGLMAIGAHGTSVPVRGEDRAHHSYGSVPNLVESFKAVVWSRRSQRYVLRRFDRDHPDAAALLVHLGRTLVTAYDVRVAPNRNIRCLSLTDLPAASLFARAGGADSLSSLIEESGRVETIQFPFTSSPWLKVWTVSERKPGPSREVTEPYNYPFSDNLPRELNDLADRVIRGEGAVTPLFGQVAHNVVAAGLKATGSSDIWGASKNVQLYVKASTLRVDAVSWAIATKRGHLQRVLADFHEFYDSRIAAYRNRGSYPINGPVEIRVSGLDRTRRLGIARARPPALSPTAPRPGRRWDVVVWISALTFPGTADQHEFFREYDRFMLGNFRGWAEARPEWSKGWASDGAAAWSHRRVLRRSIPARFPAGREGRSGFDWARRRLSRYDPHRVFSSSLLDQLLP